MLLDCCCEDLDRGGSFGTSFEELLAGFEVFGWILIKDVVKSFVSFSQL